MTPGSGNDATMAGLWTARQEAGGKVGVLCRSCSCSGWTTPSPSSTPRHPTGGRGLQDDMTFSGSKTELECTLAEAGQDPRPQVRRVGAWVRAVHGPRTTVGNQNFCTTVPRKPNGIGLLRVGCQCAAHHVGPTHFVERLEKALKTLQSLERFACDQRDHVSFAKAWMLLSRGVAHALDYDFRSTVGDGRCICPRCFHLRERCF